MIQTVEIAHHQQQVRGLFYRQESGRNVTKNFRNVMKFIPPAPRHIDTQSAVKGLHGGADSRLQLVDVQPAGERLEDTRVNKLCKMKWSRDTIFKGKKTPLLP